MANIFTFSGNGTITDAVNTYGNWNTVETQRLQHALKKTLRGEHKLSESVRTMEGFSGRLYRSLINNLIETTPDARYLEIGSWTGSTACAAMEGNSCDVLCIDNWHGLHAGQTAPSEEAKSAKETFQKNTNSIITEKINFKFIEQNYKTIDYNTLGKFNVYLFDGPHEFQDQVDGIIMAQPALDDTYVLIIDDFNYLTAQDATAKAFEEIKANAIAWLDIRTTRDALGVSSNWHNGYYIGVIKK